MAKPSLEQKEASEKALVRQHFGNAPRGFFVEVGANEPASMHSQTWHLERMGWRGILIEPNPALCDELIRERPGSKVYNVACSAPAKVGVAELKIPFMTDGTIDTGKAALEVDIDHAGFPAYRNEMVKVVTLDSILEENRVTGIDLLSIDVEGTELDVLKGFSLERYRPRLILLEDKLVYLNKHRWLKRRGYRLVKRTLFNNWYVPEHEPFALASAQDKVLLFRKLYIGLAPRKLKECLKMGNLRPLREL
ncbi:MAG TPA: FkbM family methyltransferase [Burkholderiales bacterium]|nr:FkbM family methyltransferase [Burkholderiales bacterium]